MAAHARLSSPQHLIFALIYEVGRKRFSMRLTKHAVSFSQGCLLVAENRGELDREEHRFMSHLKASLHAERGARIFRTAGIVTSLAHSEGVNSPPSASSCS